MPSTKFELLIQIKGKGGHCDYSPGAPKNTLIHNWRAEFF